MWMVANVCGEKPRYGYSFKFHTLQQQKPVWILLDSFDFIFSRHDFSYCPVRRKPKVRWNWRRGDAGRTRNRRDLAFWIPSCHPFSLRLSIQLLVPTSLNLFAAQPISPVLELRGPHTYQTKFSATPVCGNPVFELCRNGDARRASCSDDVDDRHA